jgi:predicted aspartyl protease
MSAGSEFPFQSRDGLIWLQVHARESDQPLNFLLDSGAGASVVNLPTAQKLGLKHGARVSVQGVHSRSTGYWGLPLSAAPDSVPLPKDFLAVDLGELSRACECRVDGLLGADFFSNRVVQIDFTAHKVRLLATPRSSAGDVELALRKEHNTFLVPIGVNGEDPKWVRLDTGCAAALHWVTSGARSKSFDQRMSVALTKLSVPQTQVTVQLGELRFGGVTTGLHERQIFPGEAGLLGIGLLSRFSSVTIDAVAGRVVLEKGSSTNSLSSVQANPVE